MFQLQDHLAAAMVLLNTAHLSKDTILNNIPHSNSSSTGSRSRMGNNKVQVAINNNNNKGNTASVHPNKASQGAIQGNSRLMEASKATHRRQDHRATKSERV